MKLNDSGYIIAQTVDGSSFTGLYASDGSLNVVIATDDTTPGGVYHRCGAMRVSVVDGSTPVGLYAANGSVNAIIGMSQGLYHTSGAWQFNEGLVVADPETGNPIGLLLALTYTI